jgi:hypothetical protein
MKIGKFQFDNNFIKILANAFDYNNNNNNNDNNNNDNDIMPSVSDYIDDVDQYENKKSETRDPSGNY